MTYMQTTCNCRGGDDCCMNTGGQTYPSQPYTNPYTHPFGLPWWEDVPKSPTPWSPPERPCPTCGRCPTCGNYPPHGTYITSTTNSFFPPGDEEDLTQDVRDQIVQDYLDGVKDKEREDFNGVGMAE